MPCRLEEWKDRARNNGWTPAELIALTGGVCACGYCHGIHTTTGFIPFQNKRGEYSKDERIS